MYNTFEKAAIQVANKMRESEAIKEAIAFYERNQLSDEALAHEINDIKDNHAD